MGRSTENLPWGNKPDVTFKNAIEVASASELLKVFDVLKTATLAGELDDPIAAASAKLRSGFGK